MMQQSKWASIRLAIILLVSLGLVSLPGWYSNAWALQDNSGQDNSATQSVSDGDERAGKGSTAESDAGTDSESAAATGEGSDGSAEAVSAPELTAEPIDLTPVFSGEQTPSASHLLAMQSHFQQLVEKVRPATVGVQVGGAQGSGVIVSRDGYVLTAAHVIGGPNRTAYIIMQDGTRLRATTLGVDHTMDSGLVKISGSDRYPYLDVGISDDLNAGQWVMAIGHPGGFDRERAPPIRVGRLLVASSSRLLQSDCTLVGGDSGGPLVDMDGNVIGIHSRIGGSLYQNYHVPVDTYSVNWDDLVDKQVIGGRAGARTILPVYLGCSFEDDSMAFSSLDDSGPAAQAGARVGDVLLKFNDVEIDNERTLFRQLARMRPNQTVTMVVERDGEELELEVTLDPPR